MRPLLITGALLAFIGGACAQNDYLLGETIGATGAVHNIAAFDANTLVAITAASGESIPLRSTDGGQSWRAITLTIINKSINCFAAADATTAVGVGAGGRIVRTTDAGVTWEELASPTTLAITNVFFTDASTGFATCLGAKYLTTSNGGASWTLHSLGNFFNDLYCMQWLTPEIGFAAGNGFFATTNGGDTWTLRSSAVSNVRALHFRNQLEGFVGTPGGWSTTISGGAAWTAQADGVAMENIQVLNSSAIYVSDATHMWLSTDEGISWQPYYTATENITAFRFANANMGWHSTGSKNFRTVTGGADWEPAISNMPVLDYLYWKAFEQDSLLYLTGNVYYMLRSKDLGLSWDTVHYGRELSAQAPWVDFHDPQAGYMWSSNSQLYYLTDTGRTAILHYPIGQGRIVSFDSLHVLACDVYTGSTATYSTDGGFDFDLVPIDGGSRSIHKVDAQYGFVTSAYGGVYRTSDGGETYPLMGTTYSWSKGLYFADALHGLVFDDDGMQPELSISNDGGATWTNVIAPTAPNRLIRHAYRLNSTDILLLMSDGTTYFSHDMGASFDPVLTGYNTHFREGCLTNGHFYLFGNTFAIRDPVLYDISTDITGTSTMRSDAITAYPNPAQEQVMLRTDWETGQVAYTVRDLAGRNVLMGIVASGGAGTMQLDLGVLPGGVYVLSLVHKNGKRAAVRLVMESTNR